MINNIYIVSKMAHRENMIVKDRHILLCLEESNDHDLDYLKKNFCGIVTSDIKIMSSERIVYTYGNITQIYDKIKDQICKTLYIITEFSTDYTVCEQYKLITLGMIPILIHDVGIYFREFFDQKKNYFDLIKKSHEFQSLTESNKPDLALRKGIYLSKVEDNKTEQRFNLLRCSSNLNGPTDNFREVDNEVILRVNTECINYFTDDPELNHVLAQIYYNRKRKAAISAHSDKTKDMPIDIAVIAFATFYDLNDIKKPSLKPGPESKHDRFDYYYKKTSVLTQLEFKLKDCVEDDKLVKRFRITLYPNSVFIIPISTNRLYTHEIIPSILPADKLPTRMGYVIRCSKTKAVYKDDQTYIENEGKYVKLEDVRDEDRQLLRNLYYAENTSDKIIEYGNIYFSMNSGDYIRPII
jgi:hypothetical protein